MAAEPGGVGAGAGIRLEALSSSASFSGARLVLSGLASEVLWRLPALILPDSSGCGGWWHPATAPCRAAAPAPVGTADLQDAITLLVGKQLAAVRRFARSRRLPAHNPGKTADHHAAGRYGNASGLRIGKYGKVGAPHANGGHRVLKRKFCRAFFTA